MLLVWTGSWTSVLQQLLLWSYLHQMETPIVQIAHSSGHEYWSISWTEGNSKCRTFSRLNLSCQWIDPKWRTYFPHQCNLQAGYDTFYYGQFYSWVKLICSYGSSGGEIRLQYPSQDCHQCSLHWLTCSAAPWPGQSQNQSWCPPSIAYVCETRWTSS